MEAVASVLIDHYGFNKELVRTLVLKYPTILGKSKASLKYIFDYLKQRKGIEEADTLKLIFEVPALLSIDLAIKVREIEELFQVYHEITSDEVTEIFRDFPYLYCCPSKKI